MQKMVLLFFFIPGFVLPGWGQVTGQPRQLQVTKIASNESVTIDGLDNEPFWKKAALAGHFINKWPLDTGQAKLQTEVRLAYDDKFLYVHAKMYLSDKKPVIQSLKRDGNIQGPYYNEGISIVLDPGNQKASGLTFGVNAGGAQFDGIVQYNSASFEMDTKWYSATMQYKNYWTAEFAIPFKILRFPAANTPWGVNFIRNEMTNNCFSTWNRVPVELFGSNLGCLGEMVFNEYPSKPKNNNVFIPYLNTSFSRDNNTHTNNTQFNAGLDAKIAVNSHLILDATINPDFSQVDVDQQVINLDRYDVTFPEKRPFFQENSDLYSSLGANNIRPFFSRTIGLTPDGQRIPLMGGVRLNGHLSPTLRTEVMDMQSASRSGSPVTKNYFITAFEQKVLSRSNVRAYFTNVQNFGDTGKSGSANQYNRVAGAEFNYVSPKNDFDMGTKFSGSFSPGPAGQNTFATVYADYIRPKYKLSTEFDEVGTNYIAGIGFIPRLQNFDAGRDTTIRLGYYQQSGHFEYDVYPRSKKLVNTHVFEFTPAIYWNRNGSLSEADLDFQYTTLFANRRTFFAGWVEKSVNLPFQTSIFKGLNNFNPGRYKFGYAKMSFQSNFLRAFSWNIGSEIGGYFNGQRVTFTGGVLQRFGPWVNLGVNFNYNHITVGPNTVTPFIVSPTVEIAFNRNVFWTTFGQYNTNVHNFNLNSRFQWRFRPASDLFIVYASNYLTPVFGNQNYSLTLKISYWIN